ncbi:MAG TPA: ferritin [Clostridiales bacterium]|jgi:ferritin|nr:ferritin [Clostridiales bacterium]
MFSEKVKSLLNEQITKEFYSAYLYLDFANYYEEQGLKGFANWFMVQAQEERDHALLFIKYMQNNDIKVTLEAIGKPDVAIRKHIDPLCASLTHEQFVTASIHAIYEAAFEARDFRTMQFLDWFVKEQAEEETNANDNIRKMELFGSESKGLFMLDQEMGARMYSPPSLVL